MSRKTMIIVIVAAVILLIAIILGSKYNRMVREDETTITAWANVESVYQRRADLIPNLVRTVQGAADFERGTLESVIQARSEATSVKVDPENLTQESLAAFQKAQSNLSSSLNRLMVVVERYPELKANQNFRELQAQLEGTENRINVERQKFNETVKNYNSYIRRIPNNLIAGMFGFKTKAVFEAQEGAEIAPEVDFNFN